MAPSPAQGRGFLHGFLYEKPRCSSLDLLAATEAEQARLGTGGGTEEEPPSPEEEQF